MSKTMREYRMERNNLPADDPCGMMPQELFPELNAEPPEKPGLLERLSGAGRRKKRSRLPWRGPQVFDGEMIFLVCLVGGALLFLLIMH